jgi:hypothetical protein
VLGVEEAAVGAGPDLVDDVGLKIAVDRPRNIFAVACGAVGELSPSIIKEGTVANELCIPVSEKKVLKPWSGSAALRSSVR